MEFKTGDAVVSCFFPQWRDGLPFAGVTRFAETPGDGIDGLPANMRYGRLPPLRWRPAAGVTLKPPPLRPQG